MHGSDCSQRRARHQVSQALARADALLVAGADTAEVCTTIDAADCARAKPTENSRN